MKCRSCKTKNTKLACSNCKSDNLEFEGWKENLKGLLIFPLFAFILFGLIAGVMLGTPIGQKLEGMGTLGSIVFNGLLFSFFWSGYWLAKYKNKHRL